jgi:hypothetical protein
MGMATYLAKRFMGKEICVVVGEDAETITYAEVWAQNKEYFQGFIRGVDEDEGVLEFEVPGVGVVHINGDHIKMSWEPSFNWRKAIKASLTGKPIAPSGR